MRVFTDEQYKTMDIGLEFNRIDEELNDDQTTQENTEQLKTFQRTRHISCWHDGSSISNHGHLLVTVCTVYDPALFYTDDEYYQLTGTVWKYFDIVS